MSKKKGSTMTLKDFHGGSIPSDLSLPSAPGAAASSTATNRPHWGLPTQIRSDRTRPGSAGTERGPPFPSTSVRRNHYFEEDERKPLFDASPFPQRRPLLDPGSGRSDPKPHQQPQQQQSSQVRPASSTGHMGHTGLAGNPWGVKRETIVMEDLSRRFETASAIDKVSSGRWHSKMNSSINEEIKGLEVNEERPKLNLISRTQVLNLEEKLGHQPTVDPNHSSLENPRDSLSTVNMPRPGSASEDAGVIANERPKLNLKPRSLPVEQSDETIEKERKSVFGGARPRELVLKERGIDDITTTYLDTPLPANRIKRESPKIEKQHNKTGQPKKETQPNHEKADTTLRASWRNNNWKNPREPEKRHENGGEPDTWRKPIDPPKSDLPARPGKAASPLELAQAFSRPSSDSRPDPLHIPFSRLTDTRTLYPGTAAGARRINGY